MVFVKRGVLNSTATYTDFLETKLKQPDRCINVPDGKKIFYK